MSCFQPWPVVRIRAKRSPSRARRRYLYPTWRPRSTTGAWTLRPRRPRCRLTTTRSWGRNPARLPSGPCRNRFSRQIWTSWAGDSGRSVVGHGPHRRYGVHSVARRNSMGRRRRWVADPDIDLAAPEMRQHSQEENPGNPERQRHALLTAADEVEQIIPGQLIEAGDGFRHVAIERETQCRHARPVLPASLDFIPLPIGPEVDVVHLRTPRLGFSLVKMM